MAKLTDEEKNALASAIEYITGWDGNFTGYPISKSEALETIIRWEEHENQSLKFPLTDDQILDLCTWMGEGNGPFIYELPEAIIEWQQKIGFWRMWMHDGAVFELNQFDDEGNGYLSWDDAVQAVTKILEDDDVWHKSSWNYRMEAATEVLKKITEMDVHNLNHREKKNLLKFLGAFDLETGDGGELVMKGASMLKGILVE